jgi:hypothetical protein
MVRVIDVHKARKSVAKQGSTRKKPKRRFGVLKGQIKMAKDFDAPLPEGLLALFWK